MTPRCAERFRRPLAGRWAARLWPLLLLSLVAQAACAGEPPKQNGAASGLLPPKDGWPEKPPVGNRDVALQGLDKPQAHFLLSVPAQYSRDQAWPLMIVLHGGPAGRPDDMASVFRAGLARKGVIGVFPQALKDQLLEWNYPHSSAYLLAILRQLAKDYRLDARRIYLVGHSMGGGGVWANAAVLREIWAAVGPMSGWYRANPAPPAEWLKGLPIYCIHGAQDAAVPVERSRAAFADLKNLGSTTRIYTEFPDPKQMGQELCVLREIADAGHDIFHPWAERGAREVGLMVAWLLARQREQPVDLDAAEKRLADWGKQFHWKPDGKLGVYADEQIKPRQAADQPAGAPAPAEPKPAPAEPPMTRQEKVQKYIQLNQELLALFQVKKYQEAAQVCQEIIKLLPDRPEGYYNLACAQARLGKTDEAFAGLKKAIEVGYSDAAHMKADEDLESLRSDKRFAELAKQAEENADKGTGFPYDKGAEMPGVRTVENFVKGGLRFRLRMNPQATKEKPNRLIVWLHPAGGYGNNAAERLAPMFLRNGYALLVFTQKNAMYWSSEDMPRVLKTVEEAGKTEGLDARRPILMGFSAGGQAALTMWQQNPGDFGGLILDAAYPADSAAYAQGRVVLIAPPEGEAVKKVPIFVLVGEQDGGAALWRKVQDDWLKAGVPLVIGYVPQGKHQWLFDAARTAELEKWLVEVAAGKLPALAPAATPAKPQEPAPVTPPAP